MNRLIKRHRKKKNRGASALEFALVFVLFLPFIFAVIAIPGIHALGSYLQYASFMSARAYLAGGPSEDDRKQRTEQTFLNFMEAPDMFLPYIKPDEDIQGGGIPGFETIDGLDRFRADNTYPEWASGVRFSFFSRFFPRWFGGESWGRLESFQAESFLGKDASQNECGAAMGLPGGAPGEIVPAEVRNRGISSYLTDNGC